MQSDTSTTEHISYRLEFQKYAYHLQDVILKKETRKHSRQGMLWYN